MALFDNTNNSLKLLVDTVQKKKQMAQDNAQNIVGDVLGAAKTGFDMYDKMKLQPDAATTAFNRQKELGDIAQVNAEKNAAQAQANALALGQQNIDYQQWAKNFDAKTAADFQANGFTYDKQMEVYKAMVAAQADDRKLAGEKILAGMGYDHDTSMRLADMIWRTSERVEGQKYQTSERLATQDFQTAYANLESQLKKGEMGYNADLDAKAQAKAQDFAIALANNGTDNSIRAATEQSKLDLARDLALEKAKTTDDIQKINAEHDRMSQELAQKYGYDIGIIQEQEKSSEKLETLKNTLGIQRDTVGYDRQDRRDQILHGLEMEGKQFDRDTQKQIVTMQTNAEQKLEETREAAAMAQELAKEDAQYKEDAIWLQNQLKLEEQKFGNTMLQMEKDYGFKVQLSDNEAKHALELARENHAEDMALEAARSGDALALEGLRGKNDLAVQGIRISADAKDLIQKFDLGTESDAIKGYLNPGDAVLQKLSQEKDASSVLGQNLTLPELQNKALQSILVDEKLYEGRGWKDAAAAAKAAYSTLQGQMSAAQKTPPKAGLFGAVPSAGAGYPSSGNKLLDKYMGQ